VSNDISLFAKFPTLPIDHVTFSSPTDKYLVNVSMVEVFASKVAAHELSLDLDNYDIKEINHLFRYTKDCKSIDPETTNLSQVVDWHSDYYNNITRILKNSDVESTVTRINL
jgi:hypothetical protein